MCLRSTVSTVMSTCADEGRASSERFVGALFRQVVSTAGDASSLPTGRHCCRRQAPDGRSELEAGLRSNAALKTVAYLCVFHSFAGPRRDPILRVAES